jgi:carbon monoxide dehydrogenase subunit G
MQIKNEFEVPLPPAAAWSLLMNVPLIVSCFPGAELVETIAADLYKGRVTVKLGPVAMVFSGNVQIVNRDDTQYSAAVNSNWTENKGRGNARTVTRFKLQAQSGGTRVFLDSDVQLAGQVAQYGRGAGMISGISVQLVSKFAENLRSHTHAMTPALDESLTGQQTPSHQAEISILWLLWKTVVDRFKRIFS